MDSGRGPRVWWLVAFALLLWGAEYVQRGLWEPDEARYAYVAREMQAGGHWFVPHLHGELYPDKPPLPFWLANLAALAFGGEINGISARLPTFLAAILTLWATAQLLERWSGPEAAWRGVLILFTTYLFWHEGGWGRIDLLLTGLEMVALYHLFTYNRSPQPWRLLVAYTFIGLAMLAKGPVGLAVPLGAYLAGSWAGGEAAALKRWHWAWGIPWAMLWPGAWLLIAWQQGAPAEYFQAMFGVKSFGRIIQDHHAQPIYYYLTTFPPDFLPWTIFLPAAIAGLGAGMLRRRLLAWLLFVLGLFTLFVGKRNVYVLAAFPAAAMLVAAGWEGLARLSAKWVRPTAWISIGLVALIGLAEVAATTTDRLPFAAWRMVPVAVIMLGGSAILIALYRREGLSQRWFVAFAAVHFAHWAAASAWVLPGMNPVKAPLALAAEARAHLPADQPVYLYRDQLAIIPLYVDRPGRLLRTPEEVAAVIEREQDLVVVCSQDAWEPLAERFQDALRVRPFRMGSKRLVWIDRPASDEEP